MAWIFVALSVPAISSAVNFVDKYVLESRVKDYRGMIVYSALVGFVFGSLCWGVSGFVSPGVRDSALIILAGILMMVHLALYFWALSFESTGNIIFLFQMTPLVVFGLSLLFLGEAPSFRQGVGFFLILFSVLAISWSARNTDGGKRKQGKSFLLILGASLCVAVAAILIKFSSQTVGFLTLLSYESWGMGIGGTALFLLSSSIRTAFFRELKRIKLGVLAVVFVNESAFAVSKALLLFAYSIGPVALVSVVSGTNVFFGAFYGWMLSFFVPGVFGAERSEGSVWMKVLFGGVAVFGGWLLIT